MKVTSLEAFRNGQTIYYFDEGMYESWIYLDDGLNYINGTYCAESMYTALQVKAVLRFKEGK